MSELFDDEDDEEDDEADAVVVDESLPVAAIAFVVGVVGTFLEPFEAVPFVGVCGDDKDSIPLELN